MTLAYLNWSLAWDARDQFLHGLLRAVEVSLLAIALSVLVGILLALARMGKAPLSWVAATYVNIFRGLPMLVTVLWVYFGVALILGLNFTVFQAGVISLTLLYSAFISEIYRSALEAVPRGQREAGLALGMHPVRVFARIVLPQATKIAIPNIGSMLIGMIKDTSILTVIGMVEVTRVAQDIDTETYQSFVAYTAAAGVYILAAFGVDFLFRAVERSLSTPPHGRTANALHSRRRRRVEQVVRKVGGAQLEAP